MQTPFNVTVFRAPVRKSSLPSKRFSATTIDKDVGSLLKPLAKEQEMGLGSTSCEEGESEPDDGELVSTTVEQAVNVIVPAKPKEVNAPAQDMKGRDKPLPGTPRQKSSIGSHTKRANEGTIPGTCTQVPHLELKEGRERSHMALNGTCAPMVLNLGSARNGADLSGSKTRFTANQFSDFDSGIDAGSPSRGRLCQTGSLVLGSQYQAMQGQELRSCLRSRSIESAKQTPHSCLVSPDTSSRPGYKSKIIASRAGNAEIGPTLKIAHDAHDVIMGTDQHEKLEETHMIDLEIRSRQSQSEFIEAVEADSQQGRSLQTRELTQSTTSPVLKTCQAENFDAMHRTALSVEIPNRGTSTVAIDAEISQTNVLKSSRSHTSGLLRKSKSLHSAKVARSVHDCQNESPLSGNRRVGTKLHAFQGATPFTNTSSALRPTSMKSEIPMMVMRRSADGSSIRNDVAAVNHQAPLLRKVTPSTSGKFGLPDLRELFHMHTKENDAQEESKRATLKPKTSMIRADDPERWRQPITGHFPQPNIKENRLVAPAPRKLAQNSGTRLMPLPPRRPELFDSVAPRLDSFLDQDGSSFPATTCPSQLEAITELRSQIMMHALEAEQAMNAAQLAAEEACRARDVTRKQLADIMHALGLVFEERVLMTGSDNTRN